MDLEGRLEEWCGSGKIIDGEGDCGWLIIGGAAIVGGRVILFPPGGFDLIELAVDGREDEASVCGGGVGLPFF